MMRKHLITMVLAMMAGTMAMAQDKRYKDMVFEKADVVTDNSYAADTANAENKKAYLFDLYTPHNDKATNRPLIIWMHGGGFIFGSKKDENIKLWSETFARRGYVCAGINYRMGKKTNILDFDKLIQGAYPAVLDARQAVAYFRANAAKYGIDPKKIILAGNSAGAMMALQTAFSKNAELADSLRIKNPVKYGSINDGPTKVLAVVNFWGGIYNINWLRNAATPIVSVYGSKDKIVKPGVYKGTYGSQAIYEKAKALNRPDEVKIFEGFGHELHRNFNPLPWHPGKAGIKERWLAAGQFAADFLGKLL